MNVPDPLVPTSEGLSSGARLNLEYIAGTVVNGALVCTCIAVVLGAILVAVGAGLQRPRMQEKGWGSIVGGVIGAIVCAGLNAWITYVGGEGVSIWS